MFKVCFLNFSAIFELVRQFNHEVSHKKTKNALLKGAAHLFLEQMNQWGTVLNMFQQRPQEFLATLNSILIQLLNIDTTKVNALIEQRNTAREAKNFELADSLRQQLLELHIDIQDTPTETIWRVKC